VAKAPRSRKAASVGRPRRTIPLPPRYSKQYPVGEGHDYLLRGIPLSTWQRALSRAGREERAMRVVLIRALEEYAAGRLHL
jgi:hypothetical protein